jgi:hypothetical protein
MYRSFDPAKAAAPSESYSMVVHYHINTANMTIEQVWEYGKENGAATYSALRGSAYHLPNGDILGTWADIYKDAQGEPAENISNNGSVEAKIIEIDPSTNAMVFQAGVPDTIYRTWRAGLYDGYSEQNAFLSTPLNNTTGNDLADRSYLAWRDMQRWAKILPSQWPKKIGDIIRRVIK